MTKDNADRSAGYDSHAPEFMSLRDPAMGVSVVRAWARELPAGGAILDLGCGHGVPISETLLGEGLAVHGIDAAPALVAVFGERFPNAQVACEAVVQSAFFGREFDGAVAWGLMFLLSAEDQVTLIQRVARALRHGGRFLFTSPEQACTWTDVLTGRTSVSLGAERYRATLAEAGFTVMGELDDEGENHYYDTKKSGQAAPSGATRPLKP